MVDCSSSRARKPSTMKLFISSETSSPGLSLSCEERLELATHDGSLDVLQEDIPPTYSATPYLATALLVSYMLYTWSLSPEIKNYSTTCIDYYHAHLEETYSVSELVIVPNYVSTI